jgi:hypothetical protein
MRIFLYLRKFGGLCSGRNLSQNFVVNEWITTIPKPTLYTRDVSRICSWRAKACLISYGREFSLRFVCDDRKAGGLALLLVGRCRLGVCGDAEDFGL